ncbi:hypothetical protein NFI96_015820 [Prochilodus magdalenae]|nr:hypothetical protein NFI96_015820 [Prochilodus magdalenae]
MPAEGNYDVGNWELLAIKLALEEGPHCLEGAEHPFVVWTDHKNMAYIKQWAPPESCPEPEPVLIASRIVAPLRWALEAAVEEAQRREPDPGGGPPGTLFVPATTQQRILVTLVTPGRAPSSTSHSWSSLVTCLRHFVMGLPVSQGNTAILVLVDRFSKACKLVALPGLPSARQMAELLVVRVHGMPSDLVSDRGAQFMSRYWKAFCELMGASVSLSSGFHPQSNGQTERVNQDLAQTLCCLVADSPSSWAKHLPWAEYAHNTLWHPLCQFGYPPPMFPEQERTVRVATTEQYVRRCRQAWRKARAALVAALGAHKRAADCRRQGAPTYRLSGYPQSRAYLGIPVRSCSRLRGFGSHP